MRQEYPFRVVIKDSLLRPPLPPLENCLLLRGGLGTTTDHVPPGSSLSFQAASTTSSEHYQWQRAAGLVQSPVSAANSEGSSTSTPDQCPASPALTFCEMPSSRNGSCNNSLINCEMQPQHQQQQQQHVWKAIPTSSPTTSSASLPVSASSSVVVDRDGFFRDQSTMQPAWNQILSHSDHMSLGGGGGGGGLSRGLISAAQNSDSQSCFGNSVLYPVELQQVKREETCEYFLGGRNGLVIDDKLLSLQRSCGGGSSSGSTSSKIGNFMDILRQSDRPISITDATNAAAASCSHLSQLLSAHEAPEMWIARSSRLPAMLSEVITPRCTSAEQPVFDHLRSNHNNNKRKASLEEGDNSLQDVLGPGCSASLPAVHQHHEGRRSLLSQDEDDQGAACLSERGGATVQGTAMAGAESELLSKRPKIENSNFPFKMQVRKEKLGERISALQQLVSPFGKTDTASVLLEAIGYIKFLHEQVQVLSSPYMKHSTIRHAEQAQESKHDLRSRGLCLVPVSCTLRVANDNGADYWTPTLHGGLK